MADWILGPGVIYRDTNIPTNTTVHSNGTRPTLYITEWENFDILTKVYDKI